MNSTNSLNSIFTFLLCQYIYFDVYRTFMKLSTTDVMADHELLWMLFLESSNRNIRNKILELLGSLTSKHKINWIVQIVSRAFLLFFHHANTFTLKPSVLNMHCYECYFLRAIIVISVTKMLALLRNTTNEQNKLNRVNSLNSILNFLLCQYHWTTFKSFYKRNVLFITPVTIFPFITKKHTSMIIHNSFYMLVYNWYYIEPWCFH